jgi:hypothetical protein
MLARALLLIGLIAVLSASPLAAATPMRASSTLNVCPEGPPICQFATVQEALDAAQNGDSIMIAPGSYDGGFTVDKSVSLIGSGQSQTTVSGGEDAVTVAAGSVVEIRGVTIREATETGLVNDGALTLAGSAVADNPGRFGSYEPAGILNRGSLALLQSDVRDNGGSNFDGLCGIENLGTLTMEDSALVNNRGDEQAFFNEGSATISDSQLAGNHGDFERFFNQGRLVLRRSVVANNGEGAVFVNSGVAIVTDCLLRGNVGQTGGIVNTGRFELTRSVIRDGDELSDSELNNYGTMNVRHSRVVANSDHVAAIENWGDLTLWHTTVARNQGDFGGGGIANWGRVEVRQSDVTDNTSAYSVGGGITNLGTVVLSHSDVTGNTAEYAGGGIYNTGTVALSHTTVTGNTAVEGLNNLFGGGIYNAGTITLEHSVVRRNVPDDCVGC